MKNKEFKIGDRVIAVKPVGCKHMEGVKGTVIGFRIGDIGVEFDKFIDGHDCPLSGTTCKNGYGWFCRRDEIKKIEEEKIIFKGNKTTLKTENGKKIISKCSENDKFDKEKGVLMCIAKKAGYEYQDIKNLVENSKTEKETITLTEFLEADKRMAIRCNTELEFYKVAFACNEKGKFKTNCNIFKLFKDEKYETRCIDNERKTTQNFGYEWFYKGTFISGDYKVFDFNQVDLTK